MDAGHRKSPADKNLLEKVTGRDVEVYGNLCYADSWIYDSNPPIGLYKFSASGEGSEPLFLNPRLSPAGGGATTDGQYHLVVDDGLGNYTYQVYTWDGTVEYEKPVDMSYIASDMTYDRTTDRIYGCFYNSEGTGFEIGYVDMATYEKVAMGDLITDYSRLACIAATYDGDIYGVGLNGILYKIDKETGHMEQIHDTGLTPSPYVQSAAVNPADGLLYWQYVSDYSTDMITIDLSSGEMKTVGNFADNESYLGLYIAGAPVNENAPGQIANLSADFADGSLTGTISFDVPESLHNGSPVGDGLTYKIMIDKKSFKENGCVGGEHVSVPCTLDGGSHLIEVLASNEAGDGAPSSLRIWVGSDVPSKVVNLSASVNKDERKIVVSWDKVETGVHQGWVNPSEVTYSVYQQPANIKLASDLKDNSLTVDYNFSIYEHIYYNVVASFDGKESETVSSDPLVVGDHVEIPYYEDMSDITHADYYKFIDGNNDDVCWRVVEKDVFGTMCVRFNYFAEGDDWLLSPAMPLRNDRNYKITGVISSPNPKELLPESFDIYVGQGEDISGYRKLDKSEYSFEEGEWGHLFFIISGVYAPVENGNYSVAFHAKGYDDNFFYIDFERLDVSENLIYKAPSAPENFVVEPFPKGEKKASVSLNAPSKDNNGDVLDAITSLSLYRNDELLTNFENPRPGEQLSYVDNLEGLDSGLMNYVAVATNSYGRGQEQNVSAFVGTDIMAKPETVTATDEVSHITVRWTPRNTGKNGGYVDTDNVTYSISDQYGNVIAEKLSGNEYSHQVDESAEQYALQFFVNAVSGGIAGESNKSNPVMIGENWTLPYNETFSGGVPVYPLWWVDGMDPYYRYGMVSDFGHNDEGCIYFHGFDNYWTTCATGKIGLKGSNSPCLQFYYNTIAYSPVKLTVQVSDSGADYETLATIDLGETYTIDREWKSETVSLEKFKDSRYVTIRFLSETYGDGMITLDDITVTDAASLGEVEANDIRVTGERGHIRIENAGAGSVAIYDTTGILVKNIPAGQSVITVPVSSGIYIVRIENTPYKVMVK